MADYSKEITEQIWADYLEADTYHRIDDYNKYNHLNQVLQLFGIFDKPNEILIRYKDFILDKRYREGYYKTLTLLKSDEYIESMYEHEKNNRFDTNAHDGKYNKIKLLYKFEQEIGIKHMDINFKSVKKNRNNR